MRAAPIFVVLLALFPPASAAQEARGRTLAGVVTDTTGRPIAHVEVGLLAGREIARSLRTGEDGRFELTNLPDRKTSIVVRRLGYQPRVYTVQIREGATRAFLPVVLDPMPAELEKIIVMARVAESGGRLRDFYERKRRNAWGTFIEREEIERRNPLWMSDMLRMVPGVRVMPIRWGGNAVRLRDGCWPTVWVDGMPIRGAELDEVISPSEVAGVEVYRSRAGTPVQFTGSCGAIVVWTRVQ
jgi:hypothetical protein